MVHWGRFATALVACHVSKRFCNSECGGGALTLWRIQRDSDAGGFEEKSISQMELMASRGPYIWCVRRVYLD